VCGSSLTLWGLGFREGAGTIALDPTFGSFTSSELVSLVKVFRLFELEWIVFVFREWTQLGQCTTFYQLVGERICDVLL
jgi:hypothetical protein